MAADPYRLPGSVRPSRYTIVMAPDLPAARFTGTVDIEVDIVEETDRIVLNALELELDQITVDGVAAESSEYDPVTERVTILPGSRLPTGPATIHIAFRGVLNDKLMGFYRSTFTSTDDGDGQPNEGTIAVTQFESTHARAAFPCFDEPGMKATFKVSLVVDDTLTPVSNGAEVSRTDLGNSLVRVDFAETMRMSTYLVAFVVGPLVATEPRIVRGAGGPIPLRVVHRPGSEHLCGFALDVAEAALLYFEDYYGIPYPGDKVDLVAVPDFAFGAMENLGCITFREVLLLIDPDEATQPELQRVADVINHELAHMWFGDLVTMEWWNGIWLNEAFATFMENMASDAFNPDWNVWTNFGLARTSAFDTDALSSTRPIEYRVVSPADSEGMFDVLTYEKGASVVRMLEQHLGAETFRQGIRDYLSSHAYGNTDTADLWEALEAASGQPVRMMMDGWILEGGHPLVTVETTPNGIALGQRRFAYSATTSGDQRWSVPMSIRYALARHTGTGAGAGDDEPGGTVSRTVLLTDDLDLDLGGRPAFVQINSNGNGFFRSGMDATMRRSLAVDASSTPIERFMLIDDTCAALNTHRGASGGDPDPTSSDGSSPAPSLDETWDVVGVLARAETEPAVWRRIGGAVRELRRLGGPQRSDRDRAAVLTLTDPGLERVKSLLMGPEPPEQPELGRAQDIRGVIAALRGTVGGDDHVREHTRVIFAMTADGPPPPMVDASLMAAAIEVVGYTATPAEHAELQRRWQQATTPQEELRYLTAMVDTDDPDLFARTLELTLTEVRSQNAPYLLQRAIAHRSFAESAWEFVAGNWDRITGRFPDNSLPRMLAGIRSTTTRELAERMASDIASLDLPSGAQQVEQHLERMWVTVNAAERLRR